MAKILIGVNILTAISSEVYSNHIDFWKTTKLRYPDDKFLLFTPRRLSIDNMRNTAAKIALENDCDYLMFIDDDVLVPGNALEMLLDCDADIAAGLTYVRTYPFAPMAFKEIVRLGSRVGLDHYYDCIEEADENGRVECYAIGTSLALIKTSCYRFLNPPYFVTGTNCTEDVYFCAEVKRNDPDTKIILNVQCATGHLLDPIAVSRGNVAKLREFFKPEGEDPVLINGDRRKEYIERCLKEMEVEDLSLILDVDEHIIPDL